ncbi:CBS domain-containing protein [Halorubrum vacuolatum]|uniref:CBS domain-containing protein n=1 Tax=Halorubrum vacuolatum TaxID=63740 RepID=A0A238UV50_HALVU|nr:CBS domain-containing protein [Halorubrum vacuolatum]SNR26130.1 CBS domain-containing protein [Halorubrum vacuolatum]
MDDIDDIFVARLMTTDIHTVTPDTLVEDAAGVLLDNDISSVLVVDEADQLVGILTTTDFVEIVAKSQPKAQTTVERYMSTDLVTTDAQASVSTVATRMVERGFHHMPVVDEDGTAIGIITTSDLAAYVSTADVSASV